MSEKVAKSLDDFANQVQQTQDAIRDLLHRLGTPSGLWHEVVELFEGHGLDEVKKIAHDIKIVLKSLMQEAKAGEQILQQAMQMADGWVVALQVYVRGELTHYLGDDVGNPLATAFDVYTNIGEAALKTICGPVLAIEQLNPARFFYDPKGATATWKGVVEMALLADPATGQLVDRFDPQFEANLDRQLLHLDDWRADRPGLGAAENVFDLLMLATGFGEVGAASRAADAAGAASRAADAAGAAGRTADAADGAGAVGRTLGEVGEAADAGRAMSGISKAAGGLTNDLEGVGGDLSKIDAPAGGRPGALPPPRPGEPPIGPAPPPVEAAPTTSLPRDLPPQPDSRLPGAPAAEHPTTPTTPGSAVPPISPREPAPTFAGPQSVPSAAAPADSLPAYGTPAAPPAPAFAAPAPHSAPAPYMPSADVPHFSGDAPPSAPPTDGPGPTYYSPQPGPHFNGGPSGSGEVGGPHYSGPPVDGATAGRGEPPLDGSSTELSAEKRDEILAMEKGTRPDPSEYLPPEYIEHHLDKFHDGATRFMPESNFEKYGISQRDGTSFVTPKNEADALMDATRGDPRALERALGLNEGFSTRTR